MSRMQKSTPKEWVSIAENLNQMRACFRTIQSNIHKMNRSDGFDQFHERMETVRRNLKERYQEEYPELGDVVLFDNRSGIEFVLLDDGNLIPRNEFAEVFETDVEYEIVDSSPERYSDVTSGSVNLEPDNPDSLPDNSLEEWKEVAEIIESLKDSYNYLFCGDHNLPKSAFNDFALEKAISKMRSDLEEQMFDEHPEKAEISVFYG